MIAGVDLQWAAGFLEGEGYFGNRRRGTAVTATQVQRWPLDRLVTIFGGSICRQTVLPPSNPKWNHAWLWWTSGPLAASIMMTLYPILSPKRRQAIAEALRGWRTRQVQHKHKARCLRGHEFNLTWTNPRTGKTMRQCGECHKLTRRDYYHKRIADGNPIGDRPLPVYRKARTAIGASGVI